MDFDKILIANRGEIACRIIRTAHALGYGTVAVVSEADADARHAALAGEAVLIGPPLAAMSYLKIDAILDAAARSGADAVHPGYGFLAENADFADACSGAGLAFIGPPAEAIRLMGSKRLSKLRMQEAGVPCVPGYDGEDQSDAALIAAAQEVGFPLMVKASAGGGGRGLRLVRSNGDLAGAIAAARSEAENAFGSGELILEKAVIAPRHVEIQIFADQHGNTIHLGERDCSVQRRHQKVIEEAPSPAVSEELRAAMGQTAVQAAEVVGYVGAGTVEFLLDSDRQFYFLEMNTRLQVEHPVTEEITGQDLVAWQLDIAAGKPLPLRQEDVAASGHAIEVRLYAEDPYRNFLPQTGRILRWRPAPNLRVDDGIVEGQEITPYYDSLVAKLIAHGRDREEARRRLIRGLEETVLLGPAHNAGWLGDLLRHPEFIAGAATTAFIDDHFPPEETSAPAPAPEHILLAAVLAFEKESQGGDGWRSAMPAMSHIDLRWGEDGQAQVVLQPAGARRYGVGLEGENAVGELAILGDEDGRLRIEMAGHFWPAHYAFEGDDVLLSVAGRSLRFREFTPQAAAAEAHPDDGRLLAPMAGRILSVRMAEGSEVAKGDIVVILEAMKMEHEIKARSDGRIDQVAVQEGDQVDPRQLLAVVQIAEAAEK